MLLTEVEIQQSDQQAEEFDRSAGRRAMLARGERTSCLRTGGSMSVICVGDTELAEHSDEEWYPPTPPLYDVTDKLREVNARNREEEDGTEEKQSTIRWRPDIVQVKFIENETAVANFAHRNLEETINGLRLNTSPVKLFIKPESDVEEETEKTQHFIEKICDIDDLCLNDKVAEDRDSDRDREGHREEQSIFLRTPSRSRRPDISPVVEEISKLSNNDNDTASEISEIPTDDEKEEDAASVGKFAERQHCDNEQVPSSSTKPPTSEQSLEEEEEEEGEGEGDYNYTNTNSSFDEESNCSLSTTASEEAYSSQTSTLQTSRSVSSSPERGAEGKVVDRPDRPDRSKKQKSPSHSLQPGRTNEERKTSVGHDNGGKEVKPDNKDIGEEIKVEFERQHKYIRSRDFVKKSPEDSGFESFQQSSVEQNSNQNSDDDDVIATFSTVMEVDNETSTMHDDLEKNFSSFSSDRYTTGGLFTDAEEARARSRRLREQSIQQLGLHLKKFPPSSSTSTSTSVPARLAASSARDSRTRPVRNVGDRKDISHTLCEDHLTSVKLKAQPRNSERDPSSSRTISSQPMDVKSLVKELKKEAKSYKTKAQDEDSDEEQKPNALRAVNVWKARKKEEAKLKKRYQVLWNKYNKSKS